MRSAAAFGLNEVFLVDANHKKMSKFGSQGTADKMNYTIFEGLKDVKRYCNEKKLSICGVEIIEGAQPIQNHPFKGDTVFMLGNEGTGLNQNQIDVCDQFVYIPQYTDKTASLNVAIAGSIIFHHFGLWAGYSEHSREGFKYEITDYKGEDERSVVTYITYDENGQQTNATNETDKIRQERATKKEE